MSSEPMHKITVKVGDALRTVQADTHEEFVEQLALAHESLQQCYDLVVAAKAVGHLAEPAPVQATATAAPAAAPSAAPAAFTNASVPTGPDGQPRVAKSGTSAKGPWKGWMTVARKGEPGYADPIWIKRGTPEWNNFPA